MEIYYMNEKLKSILKDNIELYEEYYYEDTNDWIYDVAKKNNVDIPFYKFKKEISDNVVKDAMDKYYNSFNSGFNLNMNLLPPSETDIINIKLFYSIFKDFISESDATFEVLWAGLTHTIFWEYMKYRNTKKKDKNLEDRIAFIKNNYFFGQKKATSNIIRRFYLIGKMFYDETNKENPFYLLDYIEKGFAGLVNFLLGYSIFRNNKILKVVFTVIHEQEFYKNNPANYVRDNILAKLFVKINALGAVQCLDLYSEQELKNTVESFLLNIKK